MVETGLVHRLECQSSVAGFQCSRDSWSETKPHDAKGISRLFVELGTASGVEGWNVGTEEELGDTETSGLGHEGATERAAYAVTAVPRNDEESGKPWMEVGVS